MFRRIALIAALVALLATPATASAATKVVYTKPTSFNPTTTTIVFGNSVRWKNNSSSVWHDSVADLFDLWNEQLPPNSRSAAIPFARAGTFTYTCVFHYGMNGSVKVKMAASDTTPSVGQNVLISWASQNAPSGFTEQIQTRVAGGSWKTWQTSTGKSSMWTPMKAKTFQFRARLRRISDGVSTPWSPTLVVTASN